VVERALKRPQAKGALGQQVPIERFDVSYIENNAVPFGDGPVVHRFFANDAEYLIGACTSFKQSAVKVVPDADRCGESSHGLVPL